MARWRLLESHYLDSPDSYWEQRETDRETGKQKMKKFMVPLHLNPKDPNDWNWKTGDKDITQGGAAFTDGEIIICREGKGKPKDIVFTSKVTPGMEPLDDEARAESEDARVLYEWKDGDRYFSEGETYSEMVLRQLAAKSGELDPNVKALMGTLTEMMTQNAKLITALSRRA